MTGCGPWPDPGDQHEDAPRLNPDPADPCYSALRAKSVMRSRCLRTPGSLRSAPRVQRRPGLHAPHELTVLQQRSRGDVSMPTSAGDAVNYGNRAPRAVPRGPAIHTEESPSRPCPSNEGLIGTAAAPV